MISRRIIFALLLLVFGFESGLAAAPGHFRSDRLLIVPKDPRQREELSGMHLKSGRRLLREFPALGGVQVVQLAPGENVDDAIRAVRASGLAAAVEPDYRLHASAVPNDPDFGRVQWSLSNSISPGSDIHAVAAWDTLSSASNIVVAVVDSGIRYTHQDLAANMWVNAREIPGNGIDDDGNGVIDDVYGINAAAGTGDPMDDDGHGTHVAGIIGAAGDNATGISGVAWNVKLMACKFLDSQGSGDTSDAIACIDYARKMGAKIINASWGGGDYSASLFTAINNARSAGIIVVTAAGNDSANIDNVPLYPACFNLDNIVVVGATGRSDNFESSYSSYGAASVDLCAPGTAIYSTWFTWDGAYTALSGTSMATPHVTGALALMKARFTNFTSSELIARLLATVDVLPGLNGKCKTSGRLNLEKALGPNPAAAFSASTLSGEPPLSVAFTNQSIGDLQSLRWNFGDGSPLATNGNSAHVFARAGDYSVRLEVVGTNGRTNSTDQVIHVRGNYEFVSEPFSWIDPSGMTAIPLTDNGVSAAQELGFTFAFYGETYKSIYVGANGLLGFISNAVSLDNVSMPNAAAPNAIVCPYWDNLNPGAGGTVYAGVSGVAPNRRFVASWVDVPRNSSAVAVTFQAILEESTGEIVFQYLDTAPQTSRGGAKRATVGLENSSGTLSALYTYNGSPVVIQNSSAIRARLRGYDYLVSTNSPITFRVAKDGIIPAGANVALENPGTRALNWRIDGVPFWASLTATSGTLDSGQKTNLDLLLHADAGALDLGEYAAALHLANATDGGGDTTIPLLLKVESPAAVLAVELSGTNTFTGGLGGPFSPEALSVQLRNDGNVPLEWAGATSDDWLLLSVSSGSLAAGTVTNIQISLGATAQQLASGIHDSAVTFVNITGGSPDLTQAVHLQINARIQQASAAIVNGRFRGQIAFPANTPFLLEYSEDLENWLPLDSTATMNDGGISFEDVLDAAKQRFYRVRGL